AVLPGARRAVRRRARRADRLAVALTAAWFLLYAGAKHVGRVGYDQYLSDAGSYLTNDVVHVAALKVSPVIPDTTPVLVFARELAQTNAADWVELPPRRTYADLPADWALPNATNHNVYVALDWRPATPAVTNYLFQTPAVAVLGGSDATNGVRAVIPRTKLTEVQK
ncbi:MAG: hypothetical protein J6Z49_03405, partial [Kiritimatiellae bacterium]|nr:hypothetical protein [Kiritimatiellia bacterium]